MITLPAGYRFIGSDKGPVHITHYRMPWHNPLCVDGTVPVQTESPHFVREWWATEWGDQPQDKLERLCMACVHAASEEVQAVVATEVLTR